MLAVESRMVSADHGVRRYALMLSVLYIALIPFMAGCSSFKSKKRLDLNPYAESMITLAADIQYDLSQREAIYLRDMLEGPEIDEGQVYMGKVKAIMRGMIAYSMELVTLAESKMSGNQRCQSLAIYLDGLLRPVLVNPRPELNLTVAQLDTFIADVSSQKKLLDGLSAAQPIIDEVARASQETMAEAMDKVDLVGRAVRQKIEAENEDFTTAFLMLRNQQVATLLNVEYLPKHRAGDPAALATLLEREPHLREVVSDPDNITAEDLAAMEQRLLFKLNALRQLREQLQPDIELYWQQNRELDELVKIYKGAIRKAQIAVIAWNRAHQRLAAGITEPAQVNILGIARKAAGTVTPVPGL